MAETGRGKRRRLPPSPTEEDNFSGPDPATTSSENKNKRKRGQRGRNHYPEGKYTVNAVSTAGEPVEPPEIAAKFHNAIGAIFRTKMVLDPTIVNLGAGSRGQERSNVAVVERYFCCAKRNNRES